MIVVHLAISTFLAYSMLSLMEYTVHRHLMHKIAFAKFLQSTYLVDTFRDHALVHHARCYAVFDEESRPCASTNIRVKPLTTLVVMALPCLLVFLIDPITAFVLFVGAILNGAVWSEIHQEMHRPRGAWFSNLNTYRYLKRRHYLHHRYPNTNFNTLFLMWDWVLGTASVATEDDRWAMQAESWRVRRTNGGSRRNAGFQDDADREWLARLSAVSVFPALLWALFAAVCLFLPFVFFENHWLTSMPWGPTIDRMSKILGVVSGFVAVLGGKSASAKLDIANAAPSSGLSKVLEFVVRLATLIFIAFLFAALGYLERISAEELVVIAREHDKLGPIAVFVLPRFLVFLIGFVPIYLLWYLLSRKMAVLVVAVLALVVLSALAFFANAMGVWLIDQARSPGEYKILIAQSFIAAGLS